MLWTESFGSIEYVVCLVDSSSVVKLWPQGQGALDPEVGALHHGLPQSHFFANTVHPVDICSHVSTWKQQ